MNQKIIQFLYKNLFSFLTLLFVKFSFLLLKIPLNVIGEKYIIYVVLIILFLIFFFELIKTDLNFEAAFNKIYRELDNIRRLKYSDFKSYIEKLGKTKIFILKSLVLFSFGTLILVNNIFSQEDNIFTISTNMGRERGFVTWRTEKLFYGDKVEGEITAKYNNLSVVGIRFNTKGEVVYSSLLFKIREKGKRDSYFEKVFSTSVLPDEEIFIFDFLLISNSKNKNYIIEIESLDGSEGNAVSISNIVPVVKIKYVFGSNEILHDKQKMIEFLNAKLLSAFKDHYTIFSLLLSYLPFVLYLVFRHRFGDLWLVSLFYYAPFLYVFLKGNLSVGWLINLRTFLIYYLLIAMVISKFRIIVLLVLSCYLFYIPFFNIFEKPNISDRLSIFIFYSFIFTIVILLLKYFGSCFIRCFTPKNESK